MPLCRLWSDWQLYGIRCSITRINKHTLFPVFVIMPTCHTVWFGVATGCHCSIKGSSQGLGRCSRHADCQLPCCGAMQVRESLLSGTARISAEFSVHSVIAMLRGLSTEFDAFSSSYPEYSNV